MEHSQWNPQALLRAGGEAISKRIPGGEGEHPGPGHKSGCHCERFSLLLRGALATKQSHEG